MIAKPFKEKGFLTKILEKGIKILIKNECKNINNLRVNILASSLQIIKGKIEKIHIIAEDINYRDLLFDKIELEANEVKIIFKIIKKQFNFKNNLIIKFRISLSEKSLRKILLSNSWSWISNMIAKEIFNQAILEDIKIRNDQILLKPSSDKGIENKEEKVDIKTKKGQLYLENKSCNKSIKIPLEKKLFIENIYLKKNVLIICANSSINFNY
tara:strand:+ start:896 stop:1534 length:639 start_codon:yes stop_codon:yes gene_type:complete